MVTSDGCTAANIKYNMITFIINCVLQFKKNRVTEIILNINNYDLYFLAGRK